MFDVLSLILKNFTSIAAVLMRKKRGGVTPPRKGLNNSPQPAAN
jgi:hypothetical protein